jgi:hypothetical protein
LAKKLKQQNLISAQFNIEMIGVPMKRLSSTGFEKSNMEQKLMNTLVKIALVFS